MGLIAIFSAVAIIAGVALPAHWLPSFCVVLFALVPYALIIAQGVTQALFPGTIVMTIWVLRRTLGLRPDNLVTTGSANLAVARASALVLLAWSVVLLVFGGRFVDSHSGYWVLTFAALALTPLVVKDISAERSALLRSWPVLGTFLALYAIVEYVIQKNLIFDSLFANVGYQTVQHWSTYRAYATFGHPLYAGTFFAASSLVALVNWLRNRGRLRFFIVVANVGGLVVTVSRGAYLGFAAGFAVIVLMSFASNLASVRRRLAVIAAALLPVATVIVLFTGVGQRLFSDEAQGSSAGRSKLLDPVIAAINSSNGLGTGPATSQAAITTFNPDALLVESSLFQIAISLGIVGLIATLVLYLALASHAIKRRELAGVSALIAFVVSTSTFNGIETVWPIDVELGAILTIIAGARSPTSIHNLPMATTAKDDSRFRASARKVTRVAQAGRRSE